MVRHLLGIVAVVLLSLGLGQQVRAQDPFEVAFGRSNFRADYGSRLSPDGAWLLADRGYGDVQDALRIMRVSDGQVLHHFAGWSKIDYASWSPDSQKVIFINQNALWSYRLATRALAKIRSITPLSEDVDLGVSPNGEWAAVIQSGGIRFYSLTTSTVLGPFSAPPTGPSLQWLPNSSGVVLQGPVIVTTAGLTRTLGDKVGGFTVSPDSSTIVQESNSNLYGYRVSDGALLWSGVNPINTSYKNPKFTANGAAMAVTVQSGSPSDFNTVRIVSASAPLTIHTDLTFPGEGEVLGHWTVPTTRRIVVCRTPDTLFPASARYFRAVDLTPNLSSSNLVTFAPTHNTQSIAGIASFLQPTVLEPSNPNGSQGVAIQDEHTLVVGVLRTLNGTTGAYGPTFSPTNLNLSAGSTLRISPDGRHYMAYGVSASGVVGTYLYETSSNGLIATLPGFWGPDNGNNFHLLNNGFFTVSSRTQANRIDVYQANLATGAISFLRTVPSDADFQGISSVLPDGSHIATNYNGEIWVTKLSTGVVQSKIPNSALPWGFRGRLALVSPNRLVTYHNNSHTVVSIWNIEAPSATLVRTIVPPIPSPHFAVSPDFRYIALASNVDYDPVAGRNTAAIRLYNPATGALVRLWKDPMLGQSYSGLAFSRASDMLFVSSSGVISHIRLPSFVLSTISNPPTVVGGNSTNISIFLSAQAGGGGASIQLSSNSDRVTVPATVVVLPFQRSVTVTVQTKGVASNTPVRITATRLGSSASTNLTVVPPNRATVTVSPNPLASGGAGVGRVSLNGDAGPGGLVFNLTSSNLGAGNVTAATVTIPAGARTANFSFQALAEPTALSTTVRAVRASLSLSGATMVNIIPRPRLAFNPSTVKGGNGTVLTVSVPQAAPSGGLVVGLSRGSSALVLPGSVTIPAGQNSVQVQVATKPVTTQTNATVTATAPGHGAGTAVLTVTPS